jgi:tetratricopeptide (TPR) repeat protein
MPVLAYTHATQSLILLEWHELESAVASARQGVALAEQWRQADARHFALTCLAQALGAAGELAEALAVNQRAMHLARDISPWYAQISAETEIALLLTKGDVLAAAEKFRAYESIIAGSKGRKPLFIAASLLLAQNRFLDVVNLLEEPLAEMRQKGGRWSWLRLLPIQAVAWQALGREAEALGVLEQCLATAEPEGYVRIFVERGAPLAALLQLARERGIKTDYISRLLAAFDMPEESPTSRQAPRSGLCAPGRQPDRTVERARIGSLALPQFPPGHSRHRPGDADCAVNAAHPCAQHLSQAGCAWAVRSPAKSQGSRLVLRCRRSQNFIPRQPAGDFFCQFAARNHQSRG